VEPAVISDLELAELERQRLIMKEEEQIQQFSLLAKPAVTAIGLGGAGCNIISWVKEKGLAGGKLLAVNTDANHLKISKADRRILIGPKTCKGLGCGGYPERGERALNESVNEIIKEVSKSNIIFLVSGLGGGTGTGATCALAEELRSQFARSDVPRLIVGVVTLPFDIETARMEIAKKGLKRLKGACDTVVVIDNNRIVQIAGNMPFKEALGVANTMIGKFIKGVTETITTASLINLDYADMRAIMKGAGLASIGVGEGKGETRIEQAVEKALNERLLDIEDVTKAKGLLVHVSGGEDMSLQEVYHAAEMVKRSIPPKAKVIWGARIDPEMEDRAMVMAVITGVESAFLRKRQSRFSFFRR